MPTASRRRPRGPAGRRTRRKVEFARAVSTIGAQATGTIVAFDVLAPFKNELGILQNLPGETIAGIKYRLFFGSTLATNSNAPMIAAWGFQVASVEQDIADLDPLAFMHQDWMEWGAWSGATPAAGTIFPCGLGDNGFRDVRVKRKLGEIRDTLWFAAVVQTPGTTFALGITTSVAVMLP